MNPTKSDIPLYLRLFAFILNERAGKFNGSVPTISYLADKGESWAGRKLSYKRIYPFLKNLEKHGYLNYICGSWVVSQEKLDKELEGENIISDGKYFEIVRYVKPQTVRKTRKTHYV